MKKTGETSQASNRPEVILPPSNDHALKIKFHYHAGWEQWVFLTSDVHDDSPESLRCLFDEHLKLAKARNAIWIDNGDLVDVIASAGDKRGTKSGVRPEHNKSNYLDLVEEDVAARFKPYSDMLVYMGRGNHDAKIIKIHETDILRRIADRMNRERDQELTPIHLAGYGGWVMFQCQQDYNGGGTGNRHSIYMKLFHGVGGGGEITKGVMEAQRMAATISNADIVVTGHVHEKWQLELVREELSDMGRVRLRPRTHLKLGSYKMDYRTDGEPTWHMQRPGGTPKPVGGTFIRFFCDNTKRGVQWEVRNAPVDYESLR